VSPRDAGYAFAAALLDPARAVKLAGRAPRGAGPAIQAILERTPPDQLRSLALELRDAPGATLDAVHPSWVAARLLECDDDTQRAVLESFAPGRRADVACELERYGMEAPGGGAQRSPLARLLDGDLVEQFRARYFPELGRPTGAPTDKELRWLLAAGADAIIRAARELGLRVVARGFCRIAREELAKLCHGLPPQDSVRLVGAVVELNETCDEKERKQLQYTHLKLMRKAGVSPQLFEDTGIAFLAAALVSRLDDVQLGELCYRLPEQLGRRLRDLAAADVLPDERFMEVYREEVGPWLAALAEKGIVTGYPG
jgi:hypothetical protein